MESFLRFYEMLPGYKVNFPEVDRKGIKRDPELEDLQFAKLSLEEREDGPYVLFETEPVGFKGIKINFDVVFEEESMRLHSDVFPKENNEF